MQQSYSQLSEVLAMVRGRDIRAERELLPMTLQTLAVLAGVSTATLSRWENELYNPSHGAQRQVQFVLHCAQMLRQQFDVPINFNNIGFMRQVLEKANRGRLADEIETTHGQIRSAGEADSAPAQAMCADYPSPAW